MTRETHGDSHLLGEGLAPTPFTAAEIRSGCPEGRTIRIRVTPSAGHPYLRVSRFERCDDEGAVLARWRVGDDDEADSAIERARVSWLDLQRHAAFPVEATRVDTASIVLPFGEFDCLVYRVVRDGRESVFSFARSLPGMPVRVERHGPVGLDVELMVADERP
jgi:hypothetical protein